ncbi:hypothetical protein ACSAYK_10565 [Escherichia coli]|uniref:hypothetical protein n=1 Tax=Escherichia coli TaxID=562 RepID=UPI003F631F87
MTTDITELAQSEINDALAQLKQISEYPTPSTQYARVLRKYFASLVEVLEKAQQVDEELCKLLPPGAEYMDPPDGGDVTPLEGVRRMVADYRQRIDALESQLKAAENNEIDARCHIAELESRTVKLPDINDELFWGYGAHFDPQEYERGLVEVLAAAGIKVEAE